MTNSGKTREKTWNNNKQLIGCEPAMKLPQRNSPGGEEEEKVVIESEVDGGRDMEEMEIDTEETSLWENKEKNEMEMKTPQPYKYDHRNVF